MKYLLISSTAFCALALPAYAELTVMSWGGAYERSQVEAYNKPFTAETGIVVNMLSADNPAAPIRSMVEAGNVTIDVADLEYTDAIRLCDEGILEEIDPAVLPPAPDGTPATEDFLDGALNECAIGSMIFGTVYSFDMTAFPDEQPTTIADFFDLEKFPGKRGLRRNPKANLEKALMADGVPPEEVYAMLETDEGLDRAFAKLDTIKSEVVWWDAGAQPAQLLADGEVALTTIYNGRVFDAVVREDKPFATVWDGQVYEYELFGIPRGAPNKDLALDYIKFATDTQRLADQTKWISYGPARRSSLAYVDMYEDGKTEMAPHMPTSEVNLQNSLLVSVDFWVDRSAEIGERFNTWLSN